LHGHKEKNPNNPISKETVIEKSVSVKKKQKPINNLKPKASEESRIMAEF